MNNIALPSWWLVAAAAGGLVLGAAAAAGGCLAIADVGDIEYGTTSATAGGTGGGTGLNGGGGTGLTGGGGSGGTGLNGGGGAGPTCSDGQMNGQETGIDCGGPDCDPCSEDCTNGEDDDGNNLVDCADPLCGGYGCAPPIPQDWTGPVMLFVGADNATLPDCGAGWPNRTTGGSGTFSAAPAQCTQCTCADPTGATCDPPRLVFYDTSCTGTIVLDHTIQTPETQCDAFGGTNRNYVIAYPLDVSGGTCAPSGGVATVDPYVWDARHVVCDGTDIGAGCPSANQVCVRTPETPFQTQLCVSQAGDVTCPGQDYTAKTLVYTTVADTRDCEDCGCDDPTGMSCDATTTVYTNQSCTMDEMVVPNDGTTCSNNPGMKAARYSVNSGPNGGSCSATGGAATGAATPGSPVTICCQP